VTADLTIRDVTRPVTFAVEHVGETTNFQGTRHAAFTATATIDREDWGLNWNMALETGGWLGIRTADPRRVRLDRTGLRAARPALAQAAERTGSGSL
jgi:hypothetical protein